jgi:geranylgeranylglycerol-phosphate geranylgeranyltransferase
MPPSRTASLARLVRLPNLLIAALGVLVGGALAMGRIALPAELLWAMGSALGLGAAGNVANDLYDVEADRVNRPDRPLVSGTITPGAAVAIGGVAGGAGLFAAWWVRLDLFVLAAGALVVMLLYSPLFKPYGLVGNLAVAAVAGLPLIYGATAIGLPGAGLVPWGLAAGLHFPRELVKDLEDVAGDLRAGRRTVPAVWGEHAAFLVAALALVAFVPAAIAPWALGLYSARYGALVLLLDTLLAVLVVRLLECRLHGARRLLKAAMVIGLAALLVERI